LKTWENDTIFPKELLPVNFLDLVDEVFSNFTAFNLRMSNDFYRQICTHSDINEFSLMEISCIGHVCKISTRNQMGMDKMEYLDFQDGIEVISKEYLKLSAAKRSEIEAIAKRKIQAKIDSEKNVPEHKKTIALPALPTATA